MECVTCVCVWLGAGLEVLGVSGCQDWVWALLILGERGICVLCFGFGGVGGCLGSGSGRVVLCLSYNFVVYSISKIKSLMRVWN